MGRKAVSYLFYHLSILFTALLLVAAVMCWRASYISPEQGGLWATMALLMPGVLLVNLAAFVWWLVRRKWGVMLLPLIAIVLNMGYVSSMVQLPDYRKAERPHDIRIATLNVYGFRWMKDLQYSAQQIAMLMNAEQVDVLCMQEFMAGRKFTSDDIAKLFADNMPYFVQEGSIAVASRFPIVAHKYVRFTNTQNDYMWADLSVGGKIVRVVTVHLQTSGLAGLRHRYKKNHGEDAPVDEVIDLLDRNSKIRAEQVREIRSVVDASDKPVILVGDFNDTPSSYTYRTMKGDLTDGFRASGSGYGGTFRPMAGLLRIDYIFYGDAFEGHQYYTSPEPVSDHKVVIADLSFRE